MNALPLAQPQSQLDKKAVKQQSCMNVDCAIIGGGPAGLATAIAISKSSPSSSIAIFEKDSFQPKGASIQISKAGWASLKALEDASSGGDADKSSMSTSLIDKLKDTSVPVLCSFQLYFILF